MKKVSEVQKELKALGCNEKIATDLLVACEILEDDIENKFKVGDVWLDLDGKDSRKITIIDELFITHISKDKKSRTWTKSDCSGNHFGKLVWREDEN